MPVTQWNDDEDDALQGLPHLAAMVYLRCLRRYMDYVTGVVGRARKISWQMMGEVTEVLRDAQSTVPNYRATNKELRAAVEQLIRVGLVIRLPKINPVNKFESQCYQLPLATVNGVQSHDPPDDLGLNQNTGLVREKYEGQKRGKGTGAKEGQEISDCNSTQSPSNNTASGAKEGQGQRGNHQITDIDIQIDRQIDAEGVPNFGKAIQLLVDGGVYSSVAVKPDHRIIISSLLRAGATREIFIEAMKRANMVKQGERYSIFYLQPIVKQLLTGSENKVGGQHATHKFSSKSSAGIVAEGIEDGIRDISST